MIGIRLYFDINLVDGQTHAFFFCGTKAAIQMFAVLPVLNASRITMSSGPILENLHMFSCVEERPMLTSSTKPVVAEYLLITCG